MPAWEEFLGPAMALGLGLLVGLERERSAPSIAGIRTFALITLAGALAALIAETVGHWIVPAALLSIVAMSIAGDLTSRPVRAHAGITTEVAIIVMFAVGVMCVTGPRPVAVVVAGAVYVILHAKGHLHRFVASLGKEDLTAIAQFVLVSLVILPVLPDETYGPFDVLNPRQIWWLVMLVVSLSLAAYVIHRLAGDRVGIPVAGILGGLISSTATTVTQSRLAKTTGHAAAACTIIMLASTVLYGRVLVLIGVTGPEFLRRAAIPLVLIGVAAIALSIVAWLRSRRASAKIPNQKNPAQLLSAVVFGAIFAVVILGVAAAKEWFGDAGLFVTAALSGLTDLDAITLSTTKLVSSGGVDPSSGARAIIIATMANTVMKAIIVGTIAGRTLLRAIAPLYGVLLAVSAIVLVFA